MNFLSMLLLMTITAITSPVKLTISNREEKFHESIHEEINNIDNI